jgi:hypothetical protein
MACPVDALELMLNVKQPDSGRRGYHQDRQLNQKVGSEPNGQTGYYDDTYNQQVGTDHAYKIDFLRPRRRVAIAQQEVIEWADAEQNERMPVQPVSKPLKRWRSQVFLDRHGRDVTHAASIQIAGGNMVPGMTSAPVVKRSECQNAAEIPHVPVPARRREQGTMSTIVEQDEKTRQQTSRKHTKDKSYPIWVAVADGLYHQGQQHKIQEESRSQLPKCDSGITLGELSGGLVPLWLFSFRDDDHGIEGHKKPLR